MKITLNKRETSIRRRAKFEPVELEIRYDADDENDLVFGLVLRADVRDVEFYPTGSISIKAAWLTPGEYARMISFLGSFPLRLFRP